MSGHNRWDGILEDITFSQSQQIALSCSRLDIIQFSIGIDGSVDHYVEQRQFWARTSRERLSMLGYRSTEARYSAYYQNIKMARLIDCASPCLSLCTILERENQFALKKGNLILFLSLNRVQKHGDNVYYSNIHMS
jgi:hypothetical protein